MEIPAKNSKVLSIKKSNFYFWYKRNTVISPPIFTLLHFFFFSHKEHIKNPYYEPKIKLLTKFFPEGIG